MGSMGSGVRITPSGPLLKRKSPVGDDWAFLCLNVFLSHVGARLSTMRFTACGISRLSILAILYFIKKDGIFCSHMAANL